MAENLAMSIFFGSDTHDFKPGVALHVSIDIDIHSVALNIGEFGVPFSFLVGSSSISQVSKAYSRSAKTICIWKNNQLDDY